MSPGPAGVETLLRATHRAIGLRRLPPAQPARYRGRMTNARLRIARLALALTLLGVGAGAAGPAHAAEESAYERAQRYFEADTQLYRCIGQGILTRLIDAGEVEHALELMERYRTGDGVPQVAVHAIYWASHAVRSGLEDRIDFDALRPQYEELSELDLVMIEHTLRNGPHPLCAYRYED